MRYERTLAILFLVIISASAAEATGPAISLERPAYDLGDVKAGKVVRDQVVVFNHGDSPLIVDDIHTSCGCTSAVMENRVIAPGQQSEMTIAFSSIGQSPGRKTHIILVHSNDPNNPIMQMQVSANVVEQVSLEPSTVVLTLAGFQEHVDFPITARNNSMKPVTLMMSDFHGAISNAALRPERVLVGSDSQDRFQVGLDLIKPHRGAILTAGVSITTDNIDVEPLVVKCLIKIEQSN